MFREGMTVSQWREIVFRGTWVEQGPQEAEVGRSWARACGTERPVLWKMSVGLKVPGEWARKKSEVTPELQGHGGSLRN